MMCWKVYASVGEREWPLRGKLVGAPKAKGLWAARPLKPLCYRRLDEPVTGSETFASLKAIC